MKSIAVKNTRDAFNKELKQITDQVYPAIPAGESGLMVLYAKLTEIEQRLEAIEKSHTIKAGVK